MATLRSLFGVFVFLIIHYNSNSQGLICFDNYRGREIYLPDDYKSDLSKMAYDGNLLNLGNLKEIFRNVEFTILDQKWVIFFADQDLINGWKEVQSAKFGKKDSITRQQQIDLFKSTERDLSLTIKSIASYRYSKNFDSHLIYIVRRDTEGYFESGDLYLLNEKKGNLLSIAQVASHYLIEGYSAQSYSVRVENEKFMFVTEQLSTHDEIQIEKDDEIQIDEKKKNVNKSKFFLDIRKGYYMQGNRF